MLRLLLSFIAVLLIFGFMDAIWLGFIAKGFYKEQLGSMLSDSPRLGVAAIFYVIYCIGIVVFAVSPAHLTGSWLIALGYGALFGVCAYAAYDLSNLATLRGWSTSLTLVDLLWGTCATGVAATLAFLATQALLGTK